jgi:DNA-binding CsgD family transcriptional regulator
VNAEGGSGFQPDHLSVKILQRLAAGESYEQIGAAEYVSTRTVRRLVSALKRRAGARTVGALCSQAAQRGWLDRRTG